MAPNDNSRKQNGLTLSNFNYHIYIYGTSELHPANANCGKTVESKFPNYMLLSKAHRRIDVLGFQNCVSTYDTIHPRCVIAEEKK